MTNKEVGKIKYPIIEFNKVNITDNVYTDKYGNVWEVCNLIQYCKEQNYPIIDVPISLINISLLPWDIDDLYDLMYHMKRIQNADLKHPILIDDRGFICDGWHRLAKAILEGKSVIKGIRIINMPRASKYADE